MIKHLLIRNWRGYEKFAFEPRQGLTFIVAENGTGKTSLLQAAAWGLFGSDSQLDLPDMLRTGQSSLSVQLGVRIDANGFEINRSWNPKGRPRETFSGESDGAELTDDAARDSLIGMAGVPIPVLNKLWFVPEFRLVEEADLFADIGDHLRNLLGIDALEAIADRTSRVANTVAKKATRLKRVERLSASHRLDAEKRLEAFSAELAKIDIDLEQLRVDRARLTLELESSNAWSRYEEQRLTFLKAQDDLTRQAEQLGLDVSQGEAYEAARAEQTAVDRALASVDAEGELIESLMTQLEGSDASCPVCLQRISGDQATHASESHRRRLATLREKRVELTEELDRLRDYTKQVMALTNTMTRLHNPEPPNTQSGRPQDVIEIDIAQTDTLIEHANRRRGELEVETRNVRAELTADDASARAELEIRKLYATEATANVLGSAARATAADRVEQALVPLAEAISEKWRCFFPGRGAPAISGRQGLLLKSDQGELRYSQLSGGEKVLASLITRLLFVTSSTGLRSIWLDEPLEHLDATNRVKAARLLVQATRPGNRMQQVVITTYEEGLARTLASRYEHVHVEYVSTDDLL